MTRHIPNLFTLLNLFFGCIAIVFILQTNNFNFYQNNEGNYSFVGLDSVPEEWWYASLFILLAAIVDFFDGFVARLLGASSDMGKQLDSLADVVSFGVAPSMILYQMLRMSYMQDANGMETNLWLLSPAFLVACAGAYRLARFNISTDQSKYFTGVPIPAIGLVVAAFPLILYKNTLGLGELLLNKWVIYAIIILLCWLMVCKYKMLSLKINKAELSKQTPLFIIAAIAIVGAIFLKWFAVPVVFVAYVVLSLLNQHKMKQ
jgi:CDP-diacylglycerol---serine O-phosphatidyltransferase